MPASTRFVVALYEPRTSTACDALGRDLRRRGLRATLKLPDPARRSTLPYGVLPYASYLVSLPNGKTPGEEVVVAAVEDAVHRLRKTFGIAALDLNGRLFGSLPA
jgi:hypothetical protein